MFEMSNSEILEKSVSYIELYLKNIGLAIYLKHCYNEKSQSKRFSSISLPYLL